MHNIKGKQKGGKSFWGNNLLKAYLKKTKPSVTVQLYTGVPSDQSHKAQGRTPLGILWTCWGGTVIDSKEGVAVEGSLSWRLAIRSRLARGPHQAKVPEKIPYNYIVQRLMWWLLILAVIIFSELKMSEIFHLRSISVGLNRQLWPFWFIHSRTSGWQENVRKAGFSDICALIFFWNFDVSWKSAKGSLQLYLCLSCG